MRNERVFASLAGANPIPASSGKTTRHRLNRDGDRQLNSALWRITMVRLATDDGTRAYLRGGTDGVAIELLGLRGALVAIGLVSPVLVALTWLKLRRLDESMERRDQEVDLLHAVPMLAGLPLPAVEELAIALEPVTIPAAQVVFAQGDIGDRCYFVEAGSAVVIGDGMEIIELGSGDMFGEIALLRHVPRTVTVR